MSDDEEREWFERAAREINEIQRTTGAPVDVRIIANTIYRHFKESEDLARGRE